MKNKGILISLFLIIALLVTACGGTGNSNSEPAGGVPEAPPADQNPVAEDRVVTVVDQLGETVVPVNPEKVVVFDFGILDSLDQLGIEIAGVPQTNIPPYLEKYNDSQYVNVGSLKEPDFEAIANLQPDLIIISGRQLEVADELQKIADTIFLGVDNTDYMASFKSNMQVLGEIFDKEAEVTEAIEEIETSIASIQEKSDASGANALIIMANEGNISAYGPGSRFGIIHDVFGIPAIDEGIEISTHGMNVSYEYVVVQDPEYLFVIDRNAVVAGEAGAEQMIENELIQNTKAYQNGNIIYLDPNYWYLSGGGLVSVSEMVKAVDGAIQ